MSSLANLISVSKIYPSRVTPVFENVNFSVDAGRSYAIIGPSGSGKTTLLGILGLLDKPTYGQYLIEGKDVVLLSMKEKAMMRNAMFGFVYQSHHLISHYSSLHNCALPLYYRGETQSLAHHKAKQCLSALNLGDLIHRLPHQLSGGQQQRLAIARAIVGAPKILLADEPTSALDHKTKNEVLDLLFALQKSINFALVMVTHDESVAKRCDVTFQLSAVT